jgi:hypothetical protein
MKYSLKMVKKYDLVIAYNPYWDMYFLFIYVFYQFLYSDGVVEIFF